MDKAAQIEAFLERLWQLQDEAGINDAELARRMGVDQALISRARRNKPRSVGSKFLLSAGAVFPELGVLLFPNLSRITDDVSDGKQGVS